MTRIRLGVIGCGLRSDGYLYEMKKDIGKTIELAALADPDENCLKAFVNCYATGNSVKTYKTGPQLISDNVGVLDAVIIGSPNYCHRESFLPAIKHNLTILLEKPVAHTFDDCRKMWGAYQEHQDQPVAVGFVLRYTNFYQKIKTLLEQNTIGKILTVNATETLDPSLTATNIRGAGKWAWRSSSALCGSFLLEKCCHDMDILNFLICSRPSKISSFAARSYFVANKNFPTRCRDCHIKDSCRYNYLKLKKYQISEDRESQMSAAMPAETDDLCIFNSFKDIPDHQTVMLEFENMVLANFTVTMDQPKTTRTIQIDGTEGQIIGDIRENLIEIRRHLKNGEQGYERTVINITHDNSGHDGGDSILVDTFKRMMFEHAPNCLAGMKEGVEACLMVFAAEKSRHENRIIRMDEMYKAMFND